MLSSVINKFVANVFLKFGLVAQKKSNILRSTNILRKGKESVTEFLSYAKQLGFTPQTILNFGVPESITSISPYPQAKCFSINVDENAIFQIDDFFKMKKNIGPCIIGINKPGYELDIFNNINDVLKNAEIIVLNLSLIYISASQRYFFNIIDFLKNKGFVIFDIFGGHSDSYWQEENKFAQLDVVFINDNGRFQPIHKGI